MVDLRLSKRDSFLAAVEAAPVVMGVLNVTPDSFSDGGRHQAVTDAVAGALQMQKEGAAIIDIGAESTRPGATPVSQTEELARLRPVLRPICDTLTVAASIDTYKAAVVRETAALGVSVVNDIWGLQGDPDMAFATADTDCALVAMHNRKAGADADIDIIADMLRFFDRTMRKARDAGIPDKHIILDPGFGFGKTFEQNYIVLAQLERLAIFGRPLLIGVSRKRMIGTALKADVADRLFGTLAANVLGLAHGARVLRVHDVRAHKDAIQIYTAMEVTR